MGPWLPVLAALTAFGGMPKEEEDGDSLKKSGYDFGVQKGKGSSNLLGLLSQVASLPLKGVLNASSMGGGLLGNISQYLPFLGGR